MINRYSLTDERLVARIDPVSGLQLEVGDKPSTTAAAVSDIAFSPDGKLIAVAVPTRDGNDTFFRVGEIGDSEVKWRPATTICGVKLVTLATTDADSEHVYAVGCGAPRPRQGLQPAGVRRRRHLADPLG
jgi:hypothetical protein